MVLRGYCSAILLSSRRVSSTFIDSEIGTVYRVVDVATVLAISKRKKGLELSDDFIENDQDGSVDNAG